MQDLAELPALVAWCAFGLAVAFGAVANRVNFCTMGAVSDLVTMGDWRRMRMWLLAIAVAIAGATWLDASGLVELGKSIYTTPRVAWLSHLVGGFLFGFGMTLASGCGSKLLIRAGAGNLKSMVTLIVLAIAGYMTLKGLFAVWRVQTLDTMRLDTTAFGAAHSDLGSVVTALSGGKSVKAVLPFAFAAAVAAFVLASRDFRASREMIAGGLIVGAIIVAGWYVTGHLGHVAEDPSTLEEAFIGTNSGSAAVAVATRTFRWEGFASTEDLVNHIVGGVLMGFGGVCALGCTIGQGLTGISTLALGSFLALGAIIAGSVAALRYQYWRAAGA
jgi:uncharacterized membrane protein YedE/YeeE